MCMSEYFKLSGPMHDITLTPLGGIWVIEVLVHWGRVGMKKSGKLNVSNGVIGSNDGSGKLSVDACIYLYNDFKC